MRNIITSLERLVWKKGLNGPKLVKLTGLSAGTISNAMLGKRITNKSRIRLAMALHIREEDI